MNPVELMRDEVEAQLPVMSSASLDLRHEETPDLPDVWADRGRLLQVFDNLIGNAAKFTKPGGRITLGAAVHEGQVRFL